MRVVGNDVCRDALHCMIALSCRMPWRCPSSRLGSRIFLPAAVAHLSVAKVWHDVRHCTLQPMLTHAIVLAVASLLNIIGDIRRHQK